MKAEGEKLVEETENFIKIMQQKYPNLSGKSAALCYKYSEDTTFPYTNQIQEQAILWIWDLPFPEKVEAQANDKDCLCTDFIRLAVETLSDLDIIITYGDDKTLDAKNDAIFSKIPAVKEGRVVVLDNNQSFSSL